MAVKKGTTGNDWLVGTDLADLIFGGFGDDTLDGRAGNDKMVGEDGNDTFLGGAGADTMSGGTGTDTVDYSGSPEAVIVSLRSGMGSGGDAQGDTLGDIENLIGSIRGDTLTGDGRDNVLNGGIGSDTLFGSDGKDILIGGAENDTLSGGADPDTFLFNTSIQWGSLRMDGNDVITDFQVGVDVLEFRGTGADSLADLSFTQVGNDTVISGNSSYHTSGITLQNVTVEELRIHQAHDFLFS